MTIFKMTVKTLQSYLVIKEITSYLAKPHLRK